ncbi:hypothetical protein C8F04DRAFT_1189707 [Mycena alexandri]|uniref:Uncharacterized protein n=1 Tax=Mycena alexandri TaxID=1745969 RepID=A0AAD6SG08_9AGAR|nr:hypothetical protein C8F04DRAFT_1189707 [Mycena alexandri]
MSVRVPGSLDVLDVLDMNFRVTRSGRAFSPWDTDPINSPLFDIATAVLLAVDAAEDEDLAEPDATEDHDLPEVDATDTATQETPMLRATDAPNHSKDVSSSSAALPTRSARDKAGSKRRRAQARKSLAVQQHTNLQPPARRPQHIKKADPAVKTRFQLMKERVASTGWIGLRDEGQSKQEEAVGFEEPGWSPTHTLPEFFGPKPKWPGFKLIKYLGPKARPILDATGRVFALSGGHADDPNWMRDVHDPAVEAMEAARAQCKVPQARTYHRRGNFAPLTAGDSYGGGQTQPGALVNGVINTAVLCSLMSNIAFIRLAGFATGLFANWSPRLFDYYATHMRKFYKRYTHLRRPFLNSIWSACTFNLGPRTCCLGHRDFGNLAFGWCAITALGHYDYTKGGHLILWDCKLILEFPPGTTLFIPSAALFHSNIPIGIGERRYSFTQYTAGGLFRWIEHGFQSEEAYFASLSPEDRVRESAEARARWGSGAGLFCTLEELETATVE